MLAVVIVVCAGCPRQPQDPEPGDGTPCESLADCNMGATCGEAPLFACVDGLCEEVASLVRPCASTGFAPDGG